MTHRCAHCGGLASGLVSRFVDGQTFHFCDPAHLDAWELDEGTGLRLADVADAVFKTLDCWLDDGLRERALGLALAAPPQDFTFAEWAPASAGEVNIRHVNMDGNDYEIVVRRVACPA